MHVGMIVCNWQAVSQEGTKSVAIRREGGCARLTHNLQRLSDQRFILDNGTETLVNREQLTPGLTSRLVVTGLMRWISVLDRVLARKQRLNQSVLIGLMLRLPALSLTAVAVLTGLLATPSAPATHRELALPQFTDVPARIDAFAARAAGTFMCRAQGDPWRNTILLPIQTAFHPEALAIPAGIGFYPSILTSPGAAS